MRFKLTLKITGHGKLLPINYQYELSSWIYKVIGQADQEFSAFLHQQGYALGHKKFKLFTFSPLDIRPFRVHQKTERIEIVGHQVQLTISFMIDRAAEEFVKGLFMNQRLGLGDKHSQVDFEVTQVESLAPGRRGLAPPLFWETLPRQRYRALSPICISVKKDHSPYPQYLSPHDAEYEGFFVKHLKEKWTAHQKNLSTAGDFLQVADTNQISLKILSKKPRSRLVKLKANTPDETRVRGWLFEFELTAPVEIQELGYYAGFGEKNSMGFGMTEICKQNKESYIAC